MRSLLSLILLVTQAVPLVTAFPHGTSPSLGKKNPLLEHMKAQLEAKKNKVLDLHGARGSNKLEVSPTMHNAFKLTNMPFKKKRTQEKKELPPARRARSLLAYTEADLEWKWATDASSECKAALGEAGYTDMAKMDSDENYDPTPPEKYKNCIDFLEFAMDEVSDDDGSSPTSDLCSRNCIDDAAAWLSKFGSTCMMDYVGFYWGWAKKLEKDAEKDLATAIVYGLSLMNVVSATHSAAEYDHFALGGKLGCFTDSAGASCDTKTYEGQSWWQVVSDLGISSDSSDDSDDECPEYSDTNYVPPDNSGSWATESDFVNDVCDADYEDDCCYTTLLALAYGESVLSCSIYTVLDDISKDLGEDFVPTCWDNAYNYICANSKTFVDNSMSRIVSACAASDKTIQPTCTQGATTVGDAFKTQMDSVGTRTASGTSSVWAPSLALLATVLLTTAGAILA